MNKFVKAIRETINHVTENPKPKSNKPYLAFYNIQFK